MMTPGPGSGTPTMGPKRGSTPGQLFHGRETEQNVNRREQMQNHYGFA